MAAAADSELVYTDVDDIPRKVDAARSFQRSGGLTQMRDRKAILRRLKEQIALRETDLRQALASDLGRPGLEAFAADVGYLLGDITHTLANMDGWAADRKVPTPLTFQPASSKVVREPLGVVCVIAPWNYPAALTISPLVAAIAAGNAVVAKPSEVAPHCAEVIGSLLEALGTDAVQVVQGGVDETTALLAERFDHIFYTGNGQVGRVVMRAAAEHLTPVTLELGGKSPAIVSRHADLATTAKRITWGKFLNAGQTCVAPDHVLVERSVEQELTDRIVATIREFYGDDPQASSSFGRIVAERHVHRLEKLAQSGTLVTGGEVDHEDRYVAPTVITDVTRDDEVMQHEIFGPVLPIIGVDSIGEAIDFVNAGEKPLALYAFTERSDEAGRIVAETSAGGTCINSILLHLSNPHLPFGGVGESGMGAYHGEAGFLTFSHQRAVMDKGTTVDPPLMYPPYGEVQEKLLRAGMTMPDPRDVLTSVRRRLPF